MSSVHSKTLHARTDGDVPEAGGTPGEYDDVGFTDLAPVQLGAASLTGPCAISRIVAQKVAGGVDNTALRIASDSAGTIRFATATLAFSGDADFVEAFLDPPLVVTPADTVHFQVQAGAGANHEMLIWLDLDLGG